MGDDMLQREGGDAIWNSVTHAVKPLLVRYVVRINDGHRHRRDGQARISLSLPCSWLLFLVLWFIEIS